MLNRNFYLEKLKQSMWNGDVKVVTGLRRVGKSVLLFELFTQYLLEQGVESDKIIRIELDQRRNFIYRNPVVLCDYVEDILKQKPEHKYYLLIDEVQMCSKECDLAHGNVEVSIYDMLNELKSYKNLDVYVTGSNSKGLSADIATEFRGRATQIHVYPLSFAEYYAHVGGDVRSALEQYMLYGGMLRLLQMQGDREKKNYLSRLFSELYLKDIVERNNIQRPEVLEAILDYLASQIGSLSNPNKIANALTSLRKETYHSNLVASYIQYIEDAFLLNIAKRYDVKGKQYFQYPYKYYYTDLGLRNARLNFRQYDPGHIMENMIYNELLRLGYSVDVGVVSERSQGQNKQKEVDFVVNDSDRRVYIQSAYRMDTPEKEEIEKESLLLTKDFFKKILLRMDLFHAFYDEMGIYHCPLLDFLLGKVELF